MRRRDRLSRTLGDLSRPDLILVTLPLLFLVVYGVGTWVLDARVAAAAVASLGCGLLVVDGLFWHAPRSE